MNNWKTVSRISKNKILQTKGKQVIDLKNYTKNIEWKNTKCLFGNNNLTTKRGMYKFNSIVDKKNDNLFELYTIADKIKHEERKLTILKGKTETGQYINNININKAVNNGIIMFGIDMDFTKHGVFETLNYYCCGFNIYINNQLFVQNKVLWRDIDHFPGDDFFVCKTECMYTFNTLDIFETILNRNPFIATLKNGVSEYRVRVEITSEGGRILMSTDPYGATIDSSYYLDLLDGNEILDTNSNAFFYEQGGNG